MYGGQIVAEVLIAQGVKQIFTLCGGHISPILVACKKKNIHVVDVRDEATTVFAADAVARLTGVPGVAAVTAGPGLTNTITAVKNAQLAQSPVVVLGGATATLLKGRGSLQDIDQMSLMKPHVKWMKSVRYVREIQPALERAFREALSGVPGPVFIELPIDLLYQEELVRDWYGGQTGKKAKTWGEKFFKWYLNRHLNKLFAKTPDKVESETVEGNYPRHSSSQLTTVLDLLKKSEKPLLVVGSQATLPAREIEKLPLALKKLNLPLYLSGMARGTMGKEHENWMRHKRSKALREADLVLLAGVPCDFRLDYGRHVNKSAGLVLINRSRDDLKLNKDLIRNRKPRHELQADPFEFLLALAEAWGEGKKDKWEEWKEHLRERNQKRDEDIVSQSEEEVEPMNPLRVCQEMEKVLGDNSILVADGGDFVATASYIVRPPGPLTWLDPGVFGTLGVGAGFALGAKLTHPDSEVWLIYGDGSAGYSVAEFDTFLRHETPIIAVVGNDAGWTQIAREQVEIFEDDVATTLRHSDYHTVAEGYGGKGILVEREEDLEEAFQKAKKLYSEGHAVLINCLIGRHDFRKGSISM